MFRRWLLFLAVLFLLGVVWTIYFDDKFQNSFSVSDECQEYLHTLDNAWVSATDNYYQNTCEYDNEFSSVRIEQRHRQYVNDLADGGVAVSGIILLAALLSFIGRWLYTGRFM